MTRTTQSSTTRQIDMGAGLLPPQRAVTTSPGRGVGGPRRVLAAAAVASPLLFSAFLALDPAGLPREAPATFLGAVAEDTGTYVAATALQVAAMATGLAGAVLVALAFARTARWLSAVTAGLLALGCFGGAGFAGMKLVAASLVADGAVRPGALDVWAAVQAGPAFTVLTPLLLAAVLGTLLMTAVLVRGRALVGWWAAPVNLLGFVMGSGEFPQPVTVAGPLVQLTVTLALVRVVLRDRG